MKVAHEGKRNAIVILNGISLKKKFFYHEYLPALSTIYDVEVYETLSKNDAKMLASKHTERYPDVIIAAGGDGTINQVVNGILKGRENESKLPVIGIIPIGAACDFFRGTGSRTNPGTILKILAEHQPKPLDVGLVEYSLGPGDDTKTGQSYFVNIADLGMGPEVVSRFENSSRLFGSEVAYYKSILSTFFSYKPMVVKAIAPEWTWEGRLRSLAVANGKYYGHGLCVAPDALMDDRLFSVFICGNVSAFDFIRNASALKNGKTVRKEEVHYKTATSVEFTSQSPCAIEADGEMFGWLPAKVSMIEKRLNFLI